MTLVSIPSILLDELMPILKDTELRVLLLVARQTIGRVDKTGVASKDRDWLAHSQLRKRTGRASEAVSAAVDSLIQKGLLEVFTIAGEQLLTPQARRFHRGILLYRLPRQLHVSSPQRYTTEEKADSISGKAEFVVGKSNFRVDKSKTTEDIYSSLRSLRFPKTEDSHGEVGCTRSEEAERAKQRIRERLQGLKTPSTRGRRER